MKRIALVSRRRLIAQGLSAALTVRGRRDMELLPLIPLPNALLDVSIYQPDVVLLEVTEPLREADSLSGFCTRLRQTLAESRIMLLISDGGAADRELAIHCIRSGLADDFIFYDSSMDYLLAKLAAL